MARSDYSAPPGRVRRGVGRPRRRGRERSTRGRGRRPGQEAPRAENQRAQARWGLPRSAVVGVPPLLALPQGEC